MNDKSSTTEKIWIQAFILQKDRLVRPPTEAVEQQQSSPKSTTSEVETP